MQTKKIFIASSNELKAERDALENMIRRRNDTTAEQGIYLKPVMWENFSEAMSQTRLQDEYNKEILKCEVFVLLFHSKVGMYTDEEFNTAFRQFQKTDKPFIYTYYKTAPPATTPSAADQESLKNFQTKLKALGHFQSTFANGDELERKFGEQLDRLQLNGFAEFTRDADEPLDLSIQYQATVHGSGALAQGPGAMAGGAGSVLVRGNNTGSINTGPQITTGNVSGTGIAIGNHALAQVTQTSSGVSGEQLESLFASLSASIARESTAAQQPIAMQQIAMQQVVELKAEVAKGKDADDSRLAKLIDGLVGLVPGAVSSIVSLFATPVLAGIAGPVTKYVLDKVKGS